MCKRYDTSPDIDHRYIAEKYVVGRKLLPNEEVHRKNRNKLDNRAKNLQVTTHGRHIAKHVVSKILTGKNNGFFNPFYPPTKPRGWFFKEKIVIKV